MQFEKLDYYFVQQNFLSFQGYICMSKFLKVITRLLEKIRINLLSPLFEIFEILKF